MKIAIHQSNFIPWYPFFQKIESCDRFVIMTNCQYAKGNYQNRFNIGDEWYTMSVHGGTLHTTIADKKYIRPEQDWAAIKEKLPGYKEVLSRFDELISYPVGHTNSTIIVSICNMLGIKTEIVHDYPTTLTGTDRLVHICQTWGATTYLSGISGKHYLEMEKFDAVGIKVEFQDEAKMTKRPIVEVLNERPL